MKKPNDVSSAKWSGKFKRKICSKNIQNFFNILRIYPSNESDCPRIFKKGLKTLFTFF